MNFLFSKRGFLPFALVLFINTFISIMHQIIIGATIFVKFDKFGYLGLNLILSILVLFPFVLLFSLIGFINDKYSKTTIIRICAICQVILSFFIFMSYHFGWFYLAMILCLFVGIQNAFYSPAKFALHKKLFGVQNLGYANGFFWALMLICAIFAFFIFSIFYDILELSADEILINSSFLGFLFFVFSIIELIFASKIPNLEAKSDEKIFSIAKYFKLKYFKANLKPVFADKELFLLILGLSIFWFVVQILLVTFLAHFQNFGILGAVFLVGMFGFVVGSMIASSYSKKHIELGIVPFGALGISLAFFLFSTSLQNLVFLIASFIFGMSAGVFVVPLNAMIQYLCKDENIGTILSTSNFFERSAMFVATLFSLFFVWYEFSTSALYFICTFATLFIGIYSIKLLPHLFVRILLLPILKQTYKVNVNGLDRLPLHGGVLLLGNHVSWIDWLILQIATPRPIKFVMFKNFTNHWYIKLFFKIFKVIPIENNRIDENSAKFIKERLNNGEVVALFPEGHISYNGHLGEFQKSFEEVCKDADCVILPFYLRGLWGSTFSKASKSYKELSNVSNKREISVSFGKAMSANSSASDVKNAVFELSFYSWGEYIKNLEPAQFSWIKSAKRHLFKTAIADSTGLKLNNLKFITLVLVLLEKFKHSFKGEKHIGIILPSCVFGSAINLLCFIKGKVVINLNYTLSEENLLKCAEKSGLKTIISSKQFISKLAARGFDLERNLSDKLVYLEDISKTITKKDKTKAFVKALFMPSRLIKILYFLPVDINDLATIVFSSGSEGEPKGIMLTHKNLMANIKQIMGIINQQNNDVLIASLPLFHSFGLTVTTILPLSEGMMSVHIADPTDGYLVGSMVAKFNATILLGTSTFFRLYTRNKQLNPLMFSTLRIVVAGAEKLQDEVKKEFKIKFGCEIYEGYGTTETTPVVSCNMPNCLEPDFFDELIYSKPGTVGLPLPGTLIKIVDENMKEVKIGESGLILIGGHQVMQGYFEDLARTNEVITTIDGIRYYKSGDIGLVDEDGFLKITDRVSRFAKLGGEMISLALVEKKILGVLGGEIPIICVALPDSKKGEKIVLLYVDDMSEAEISDKIRSAKIPPLMIPAKIYKVDEIPVLGIGKIDLKGAKELAKKLDQK